jgi:hypothetical protein
MMYCRWRSSYHEGWGLDPIKLFDQPIFLYPSQTKHWISNVICRSFSCVQWVQLIVYIYIYIYIYICRKWLPFETVLGVWNFRAVLQHVLLDKLNVFCLCKIVLYACHMFFNVFSLHLLLFFFKNKPIIKKRYPPL